MSKTRLFEAVKTLDLKATKKILEAKPELLKVWNDQGRNLLHMACSVDCTDLGKPESASARMVAYFLDSGFDIEEEYFKRACHEISSILLADRGLW